MADERELATLEELEHGLRFGHLLMSVNRHAGFEAAAYAQALVQLLLEKEIITPEEFEEKVEAHRQHMSDSPEVMMSKAPDKYDSEGEVIIDCASRVELCLAACCSFRFYLSPQDLSERIVKWDYGNPYWVRHNDGYCVHCDRDSYACQVHDNRPYTCRAYDCRQDKRVWVDFEKRIPNPDLAKGIIPPSAPEEAESEPSGPSPASVNGKEDTAGRSQPEPTAGRARDDG